MKVKVKIVNKDIDQNREFEVLEEHANCYILKYDDKFLTVKKEWCEVIEESKIKTKTIRITKDLNVTKLMKGDTLTAEIEIGERYISIRSGILKGFSINKDCFEYIEDEQIKQGFTVEFKKYCRNCKFDPDFCKKNNSMCIYFENWEHNEKFNKMVNDLDNNNIGSAKEATHYMQGEYEPILVMQDKLTKEQFEGFLLGNVIKYSLRMNHKLQNKSDAGKCRQYSEWLNTIINGNKIVLER